jgi:hypothetical protein
MQGESRRARIDVANSSQKQRGQHLPVGNTAAELLDHHFRALVARRPLDQADQGFDFGAKFDNVGSDLSIGPAEEKGRGKQSIKDITPGNRHPLFHLLRQS